MERTMDLTLISAKDLKDVNRITKMEVYAVAWLSSDLRSRRRTATDRAGRRNPSWCGATFRFIIPRDEAVLLHVLLRSERSLGDRDIGEVCVPLKELYTSPPATAAPPPSSLRFASYQVRRPCGKSKGVLNFSFKFAGPIAAAAPPPGEPLMAYPAGYAAVYPPPPQPPAYPLYPQPAYGYGAQPPAGYGFPPPPPPPLYGFPPPPPARRGAPSGWFWAA